MGVPAEIGDRGLPVVILAGGMGTRLREETDRVPKPLVEIGDRPILWHIMKLYNHYGHSRFILCVGYKSWLVKEYFLRYREHLADLTIRLRGDHTPVYLNSAGDEDWEVTCAETGLLSATGTRLWRVRDYVDSETFFFTYGDGLGRVDIPALLEFHNRHGRIGTVTGVRPTSRYGEMLAHGERVIEFNEKPTAAAGLVSGGFFVFNRQIFEYLSDDPTLMLEHVPLQKLARDDQLAVFEHHDYWLGMDTYRDLVELNDLWSSGRARWKVWTD
jgi:glucose-1-phosphate cytidylyltransferase